MEAEGKPYDRVKGGEQPGTKRSPDTIRTASKAILRHLSPDLSAAQVKREKLLDLAEKREREVPTLAPQHLRFLPAGLLLGGDEAEPDRDHAVAV